MSSPAIALSAFSVTAPACVTATCPACSIWTAGGADTKIEPSYSWEEVVLDKSKWVGDVDRLMKRHWRIGTAAAGLSDAELTHHWGDGTEAAAFVAWFAEKYDLIRFEPDPFQPSRS